MDDSRTNTGNGNTNKRKTGALRYTILAVVIAAVLAGAWFWYRNYSRYISTDDAKISTYNYNLGSVNGGRLLGFYVQEGDTVREGQPLALLDSTAYAAERRVWETALRQAEASLAEARVRLKNGGRNASESVMAQAALAESRLENARAQLDLVRNRLAENVVRSPIDGVVLKRWLTRDEIARPGQTIVTVADNDRLWVDVFLEETKIRNIRPGQEVHIRVDAFPDVKFRGRVLFIGGATAGEFSLIPPTNDSGNFTKVTQRIPLRVSLEGPEKGGSLPGRRLAGGMSVQVKIVKNR